MRVIVRRTSEIQISPRPRGRSAEAYYAAYDSHVQQSVDEGARGREMQPAGNIQYA